MIWRTAGERRFYLGPDIGTCDQVLNDENGGADRGLTDEGQCIEK